MLLYIVAMGLIKNFSELAKTPQRRIVLDLIEEGLSSVQPENVLSSKISLQGSILKIQDSQLNLEDFERIFLIGFGKGSSHISRHLETLLGDKLTEGFVIDITDESFSKINYMKGTHPLPSQANLDFTKTVVNKFENGASNKDLILVVIAGGGSALFELPKNLSLNELVKKTDELIKSGMTITQMNDERKKLSRVKGGGLAKILYPARVVSLIFSDVPGNDLSVIASGPTERGINESEEKYFDNVSNILMLSNRTALSAMEKKAQELGIPLKIYSDKFQGDARGAGEILIGACPPGSIVLSGGETTVHITGSGVGGRNMEVVLNSLSNIGKNTIISSFASDGWDNSEAAGAIGDIQTLEEAKKQNLSIEQYLKDNNSLEFFQKTGDAIITDRLPSNVSDLIVIYKHD